MLSQAFGDNAFEGGIHMTSLKMLLLCLAVLAVFAAAAPLFADDGSPQALFPIQQGEKWGYIDRTGSVVIAPQFEEAIDFTEGLARVLVEGKWGYVDTAGKMVIPPTINIAMRFSEGLAAVLVGGKPAGELIGKKPVGYSGGKWGYIDRAGKVVIKPEYMMAEPFSEGLGAVTRIKKSGRFLVMDCRYIDKTGKTIIKADKYYMIGDFGEGLAPVLSGSFANGKWVFIDKSGKKAIDREFDEVQHFSGGLTAVKVGDKWGYIDKSGVDIVAPSFGEAGTFSEGLAAVKAGDKWGYIDKAGAMAIKPQFDDASGFSGGLAAVMAGGKWGYIDKTGNTVIPTQFTSAASFRDGLAFVRTEDPSGEKIGYIDPTGKYVWQPVK